MKKDYGNMLFTETERKELVNARKKICDYVISEIIPNMVAQKSIKIDFGGRYVSPRNWSSNATTNYHFYIYAEPHHFYGDGSCGYKDRDISIGFSEKYGYVNDFEKTNSPYNIYPIVDNWSEIKSEIRHQLSRMIDDNAMVMNFEV